MTKLATLCPYQKLHTGYFYNWKCWLLQFSSVSHSCYKYWSEEQVLTVIHSNFSTLDKLYFFTSIRVHKAIMHDLPSFARIKRQSTVPGTHDGNWLTSENTLNKETPVKTEKIITMTHHWYQFSFILCYKTSRTILTTIKIEASTAELVFELIPG